MLHRAGAAVRGTLMARGVDISASRDALQGAMAHGAYYAGVRYRTGQLSLVQKKSGR